MKPCLIYLKENFTFSTFHKWQVLSLTTHTREFEYVCVLHTHNEDHNMVEYKFTVICELLS